MNRVIVRKKVLSEKRKPLSQTIPSLIGSIRRGWDPSEATFAGIADSVLILGRKVVGSNEDLRDIYFPQLKVW